MLNIFRRRRRRSAEIGSNIVDDLVIRDLLEHPALRAVMTGGDATSADADPEFDCPVSLEWARLVAAGPIRFDRSDGSLRPLRPLRSPQRRGSLRVG